MSMCCVNLKSADYYVSQLRIFGSRWNTSLISVDGVAIHRVGYCIDIAEAARKSHVSDRRHTDRKNVVAAPKRGSGRLRSHADCDSQPGTAHARRNIAQWHHWSLLSARDRIAGPVDNRIINALYA
jgi:hypothetical protein